MGRPVTSPDVWAIVVAGGSGSRFGEPKQFLELDGRSLLQWAIDSCATVAAGVVVALPAGTEWEPPPGVVRVDGGASRVGSVRAALAAVPSEAAVVVVHDPAHPLAPDDAFRTVVAAIRSGADASAAAIPMNESIKVADDDGWVRHSLPKPGVMVVQTPHAFRTDALRAVHAAGLEGVEDTELVEQQGGRVLLVPGDAACIHITTPEELELVRAIVRGRRAGSVP
jgi:2-C-methyl-D-erythritol 4-phosphate cytidylyltransferase